MGTSPARGGALEIATAAPGVSTRTRPAPDLFSWFANLFDNDLDFELPGHHEKLWENSDLIFFFDDADANDALKAFTAGRTDAALAAVVASWEASHTSDKHAFYTARITRTEIVIASAFDDDHGYGSAIGLSTCVDDAALAKLVDSAMATVVDDLDNQQAENYY